MPAHSRYDQELVFEEVEFYARRHGKATLEMNRRSMMVSAEPQEGERACSRCAKPLGPLWFTLEERWICRRCARKTAR